MSPSTPTLDPARSTEPPDPPRPGTRVAVDDNRIIGGVAGYLAGRLGVDALWVRIAFVLLGLAGGIGLVLYAGLWLVLSTDANTGWRWPRVAGGLLVVVGIPLLLNAQAGRFVTGPVAVALLLTGLAVALWRPPPAVGGAGAAGVSSDDRPPSSVAPLAGPGVDSATAAAHVARPVGVRPEWRPPRPARAEPSILGRAALGLAIAVAAVGALVDEANGGRLHPEQWLGAAAVVCGLGLLVGAVRGHARWLIVPAAVLAGTGYVSGLSARLGIDPSDTFGERWVSIGEQDPGGTRTARSAFGSVDVYIDGVPAEPVTVDARVGFGDIAIRASDAVTVEVRSRVDNGDVDVDGSRRLVDGPRRDVVRIGPEGRADVVVEAWVGRGDVNIDTYSLDQPPPEPLLPDLPHPPFDAPLAQVSDFVAATSDGWFVLGDGSAVIDPDDVLVVGEQFVRDGVNVISTPYGEFQLLPRSLLITPFGQVLDLQAIRADLAATSPTITSTPATTTAATPTPTPTPAPNTVTTAATTTLATTTTGSGG